jgi:hypothetical protein
MEFKFIRNGWLGFYSDALRMLGNYMICKKEGTPFFVNSKEWTFTYEKGWHDYFVTLEESPESMNLEKIQWEDANDRRFTVAEYKQAMKEVFVYQPYVYEMADKVQKELDLGDSYTAIFIRRGDKLLGESVYIPTEAYVFAALSTNPSVVFIQTDDYRVVEEIRSMIKSQSKDVRVVTTCPPNKHGHFVFPVETSEVRTMQYRDQQGNTFVEDNNVKYLNATARQKPLMEFTKEEMKAHVDEMLAGLILCQRSKYLVIDHTSNVGRYLHFTHPGGRSALRIIEDLNIMVSPTVRLLPYISYRDDEYISNPRYHCIHNRYT